MSIKITQQAIERFTTSIRAEKYHIRIINAETEEAVAVTYTADTLIAHKTVNYLRHKNICGSDVYVRPAGWQYVLLDDLTVDALACIKADDLRLCAIIETSPNNYQAWLILPTCPSTRDEAKDICRLLAQNYGADLGSAEPDHVGRLPGLTNRKPKYRKENGQFPFVRLCRAEYRLSTFSTPKGEAVLKASIEPWSPSSGVTLKQSLYAYNNSYSEHDFGIVIGLIKKGWDDESIGEHLRNHSPRLSTRKGKHTNKYISRTIANARRRHCSN